MKNLAILALFFLLTSCSSFNATSRLGDGNTNKSVNGAQSEKSNSVENLLASGHSSEKGQNSTSEKKQTSTESPMARPIDVSEMTAEIEKAKAAYEKNPKDKKAQERLAQAYFKRAFALTEAAQYRAALGDFRKGLKLKPDDKDAKAMHDRILSIFASLKREPPKEGEEPPPLPFNKGQ